MSSLAESAKPATPGVAEFMGSMPASYTLAFSQVEIDEHAGIVARRRGRPVHVERCPSISENATVICVVADDRAGLLSVICQVLVGLHIEVVSAQIYSRETLSGTVEAVDFFWVRAQSNGASRLVTPSEVSELERKLGEALSQNLTRAEALAAADMVVSLDPIPAPRAFFDRAELQAGKYVLVVESRDYPGLLLTITKTLHHEKLAVLSSEVITQGWLARDRFQLRDLLHQTPTRQRLAQVRGSVLSAVRLGLTRHLEPSR